MIMERGPFWAQNTWRCWQMWGNYSTYQGMLICTNEGKAMQQKYVKAYGCWYTAYHPIFGCSKASTNEKEYFSHSLQLIFLFMTIGVFIARGKEDALVTKNIVPGETVYGEKKISVDAPVRYIFFFFLLSSSFSNEHVGFIDKI